MGTLSLTSRGLISMVPMIFSRAAGEVWDCFVSTFAPFLTLGFRGYGKAATEQLLPSSLRDATSLNEGGIGKIRNSIILPKAPSPRELARREP